MKFESVLKETAEKNMAHVLAKYCYELTKSFNAVYNNVHILNETDESKKAMRLSLIKSFSEILKQSFNLLGIDMPERM
jgi:arginyl-tRNA synthetase